MPDALSTSPLPEAEPGTVDALIEPLPKRIDVLTSWLAGRPLVSPAVGLVAGISLDATWPIPFLIAVILFVAAGVTIAIARHKDGLRHWAIALAALALGAALHDSAFRRLPAEHIVQYCGPEPTLVRLTGTVLTQPTIRPHRTGRITWLKQSPRTRLQVAVEKTKGTDGDIFTCGTVTVYVRQPVLHVSAGDRVELLGKIYRPMPPVNPGTKDWSLINRRNGILVNMSCRSADNVVVMPGQDSSRRWLSGLRRRARAAMLEETFSGDVPGAQLLAAMVLGQRSAVDPDLSEAFVTTGTAHYLAVSGLHVGMLASAIWLIVLAFGGSGRTCALWILILVTGYAVLAEPRQPILRAAIMVDLFCLAVLLRRPTRSANWLALSAIVLLVIKPTQLFMPGFQLSFLTVIAVIFLTPRVHGLAKRVINQALRRDDPLLMPEMQNRLNPPSPPRRILNWITRILGQWLAVGLSAWLVSTLLAVYHFQHIAIWGWLNTVLLMPLVWIVMVVGLAKTVMAAIWAPAAAWLGQPLAFVTDTLIEFVQFLARLPGAGLPAPAISGWLVAAGLMVLLFWVIRPWLRISRHWVAIAGLGFVTATVWHSAPAGATDILQMHILSVGNGTASVIHLPNGKTLVYDMGSQPPYDLERATVGPLLARERIYHIDAAILSHPNLDHYSGLPDLIEHRSVNKVIAAPHFTQLSKLSSASGRLVAEVKKADIPWQTILQGDRLSGTGAVGIEVLWPPPVEQFPIEQANNSSVVLSISYADKRILICGDIEEAVQRQLLASADLRADLLVLPHHGGVRPSTKAFIEAVNPEYCVRSSGQRDSDTRNGLLELVSGRSYFNTADDGAVEIQISPKGLVVLPMRNRR